VNSTPVDPPKVTAVTLPVQRRPHIKALTALQTVHLPSDQVFQYVKERPHSSEPQSSVSEGAYEEAVNHLEQLSTWENYSEDEEGYWDDNLRGPFQGTLTFYASDINTDYAESDYSGRQSGKVTSVCVPPSEETWGPSEEYSTSDTDLSLSLDVLSGEETQQMATMMTYDDNDSTKAFLFDPTGDLWKSDDTHSEYQSSYFQPSSYPPSECYSSREDFSIFSEEDCWHNFQSTDDPQSDSDSAYQQINMVCFSNTATREDWEYSSTGSNQSSQGVHSPIPSEYQSNSDWEQESHYAPTPSQEWKFTSSRTPSPKSGEEYEYSRQDDFGVDMPAYTLSGLTDSPEEEEFEDLEVPPIDEFWITHNEFSNSERESEADDDRTEDMPAYTLSGLVDIPKDNEELEELEVPPIDEFWLTHNEFSNSDGETETDCNYQSPSPPLQQDDFVSYEETATDRNQELPYSGFQTLLDQPSADTTLPLIDLPEEEPDLPPAVVTGVRPPPPGGWAPNWGGPGNTGSLHGASKALHHRMCNPFSTKAP
jgi:hypothetical protein